MITPEQLEAALAVLTDEEAAAEAHITAMRAENERDLIFAKLFLNSNQNSVEARKLWATTHPDYQEAMERWIEAQTDLKAYQARVTGAKEVCSIFQTQSANARQSEWIK